MAGDSLPATAFSTSAVAALPTSVPPTIPRNMAVDAYRGLVMLLMMGEVLKLPQVAQNFPSNPFWHLLGAQQTHAGWAGCTLHDTIQPGFSFLVGVSVAYSLAGRRASGSSMPSLIQHSSLRGFLLVILGIFLNSMRHPLTDIGFDNTLTQIGLGYPILFLLAMRPPKWQALALGAILAGYWLLWALYPAAGPVWPHDFTGFAAHWGRNSNPGVAFDRWFLNLFPRTHPYLVSEEGYVTLSFIPTLGTMILGLFAGQWMRAATPAVPMRRLLAAAGFGIAAGLVLHATGICPVVKRVWTPSWTLFSGGFCFLFLAAFCWVIEVRGYRRWAFPLIVAGMNSLAAYWLDRIPEAVAVASFRVTLGSHFTQDFGPGLEPMLRGLLLLLLYWLTLYWMYRRKLFLRI